MRDVLLAISIFLMLTVCSAADESSGESLTDQLVGSWNLVEYGRRNESGTVTETFFGDNPLGILVYTSSGNMSVHLVDPDVGEFASGDWLNATPAEIKEAYQGYFGYFGTYTVDEDAKTVTHHVVGSSFRSYMGADMTRFFELNGNKLSLVTGVEIEGGKPWISHSVWERRD